DMEIISRVFRAMHTLKGSGAMFGFDDIAGFTHTIETVYDLVRSSSLQVTPELISLTLAACDQVKVMLEASLGRAEVDESLTADLSAAFRRFLPSEEAATAPAASVPAVTSLSEPAALTTYRIRFQPNLDLFANGTNPVPLLNELRSLGECSIIADIQNLPDLESIDPESCYTAWDIILTTASDINTVKDTFIFVEDLCHLTITPIETPADDETTYKKVGEILIERGDIRPEDLEKALHAQKRLGEMLVEAGSIKTGQVISALKEQEHVREYQKKRSTVEETASIRVPALKLDALVNLVGELVTVQARLSQYAGMMNDVDLSSIAEEVESLSAELRDISMGIRMLPIGTTFAKFKRLVRDLSSELGKDIAFTTQGAETELDKTVIDKLSDPLVHLIRNSIDHGIESPEERTTKGKSAQGTIHLAAQHSGAYVLITVADDGAGIDAEVLRRKAVEKGIITADAVLSEQELYQLIFAPGFSTAAQVTSVSGRGVGMDVVKNSIDSLGGSVEIESTLGTGTAITLKLPLTLAIIDGLLVRIASEFFVLPLGMIVECVELTSEHIRHAHGRHLVKVREEIIPYISLREIFSITSDRPSIEQVVIADFAGRHVGFVVDKVVGQHQTVIKNLGKMFKEIHGVSGATIMGDGSVALILDVNRLVRSAEISEV
ncbi:MAG: chemotaxis protein CheA, partial [Syntrophaceae bacterium]